MNVRQVMGAAGGFLIVYVVITLTNKPVVTPRSPHGELPRSGEEGPRGGANAFTPGFMKGLTLAKGALPGWDGPRFQQALAQARAMGCEWVALAAPIPQVSGKASAPEMPPPGAAEDLARGVQAAHAAGLKAFVRPVVVCADGTQRAFIEAPDASMWFAGYRKALVPYLKVAAGDSAELFSIGTGLSRLASQAPWDQLARELRRDYRGYLTYEAAWGELAAFPHWASLDYAGAQVDLGRNEALNGPPSGVANKPVIFTSVAGPGGRGIEAFLVAAKAPWAQGAFVAAFEAEADRARPNPFALDRNALEQLASAYGGQAPAPEPSAEAPPSEAPRSGGEAEEGRSEGRQEGRRPDEGNPAGGAEAGQPQGAGGSEAGGPSGGEAGSNALEAPPLDAPSPLAPQ